MDNQNQISRHLACALIGMPVPVDHLTEDELKGFIFKTIDDWERKHLGQVSPGIHAERAADDYRSVVHSKSIRVFR